MSEIYSLAKMFLTTDEIAECIDRAARNLSEDEYAALERAIADVRRFTKNIGDKSGLELMAKIGIAMADRKYYAWME